MLRDYKKESECENKKYKRFVAKILIRIQLRKFHQDKLTNILFSLQSPPIIL